MTKLVIVDDNELITEGLKVILNMEESFEEIHCFSNAQDGITFCRNHPIDLVLMDVRMPEMNGVEAAKIITDEQLAKVLILSTFDEDEYIAQAIENGASGYLLKNTEPKILIHSIHSVLADQQVLSGDVWEKAKRSFVHTDAPNLSGLTPREMEITELVAKGLTNKQIAQQLFLSEGTVNNNLSVILNKLGLEHRTQLAIFYLTGKVGM
ncbi:MULTISPECIES: response regulator [unclassified Enterococcus]|jgi:DNA-binding NarL/FixJ family response regulator|uniref:response regulator n=1 Tax=unclassified Enterococcus TaxID=2608891 RepID=UPI003D2B371C